MNKRNILLIDGWNLLISQNAVSHIQDGNSVPIGMYLSSLNVLRSFIDKFKPIKVFFVLDGPEAGERRRQLYPNYKGKKRVVGRESKVMIMEGDENMVYGVEGAFQNQLIQIFDFLKFLPVTVCIVPYCEADDIIAYLTLKNKEEFENIIVSNDRDYLQLVQEGISVYRWKAKMLYDKTKFLNEFRILADNFIYRKILLGDVSDAIVGIKGIGEKTFERFIKDLSKEENNFKDDVHKFIDFLKVMDLGKCNTRERNAISKILNDETIEKIILLYKIMKLDESCMLEEQVQLLRLQVEEQKNKKLLRMSAKMKMNKTSFNKLYNGFNEDKWIQPFYFLPAGIEVKV